MKPSIQTSLDDEKIVEMEKNTIRSLKTTKAKVKHILENYGCTRGDYRLLEYYYIRMFGHTKITFRDFEDLRKNPAPESISRLARMLVNENPDLRPSERTVRKRAKREAIIRQAMRGGMV